jgi:integrase
MGNTASQRQPSTGVNVTVGRDYLTEREVERLMKVAGDNRYGHRNATAILVAYRHGLRASELVALRWDDSHWRRIASATFGETDPGCPFVHGVHPRTILSLPALFAWKGVRQSPSRPSVRAFQLVMLWTAPTLRHRDVPKGGSLKRTTMRGAVHGRG